MAVQSVTEYARERAAFPGFLLELKRATRRGRSFDEYLDVAYGLKRRSWCISPNQVRSEIRSLLCVLAENPPERLLEIGTASGGTLYLFARVCAPGAELMSVDLPQWQSPLRSVLLRSFASAGQRVRLPLGDSHGAAMGERVRAWLGGRELDFLFIDGDHSFEGALADFELYRPLVRAGGRVALHDIVPGPAERVGGVPKLWQQLREQYPSRELVESRQQGGWGIGLLEVA